jgi:hypothetical protein
MGTVSYFSGDKAAVGHKYGATPYTFPLRPKWETLFFLRSDGKGKVVPCAELIKHYAMKAYGGVDV